MSRRPAVLSLFVLVLAAASVPGADEPRPPAPAPWQPAARVLALVGGTLIDGFGGAPLRNSVVIVDGARIKAVGQVGSLAVPAGAEVISTEGMSVLPGLWDMHVHTIGVADARAKVQKLADAGVDVIKLIDQDQMTIDEVRAVIDEAHARRLAVVAHAHRPEEIRRALKYGADDIEHTGLATAPEYPADVIDMVRERTAQMALGPFWWTPTVEALFNYEYMRDNPEMLDDPSWTLGLPADIIADIRQSLQHPGEMSYFQLTPARRPTLKRKFTEMREAGATLLIGTDSGTPMQFHSQSTWNELDIWVREMGVPPMEAIRSATYWPSVMLKKDKDVGTITPGKYADIIAVRGDVLRYINLLQRVDVVVKHGKRVK